MSSGKAEFFRFNVECRSKSTQHSDDTLNQLPHIKSYQARQIQAADLTAWLSVMPIKTLHPGRFVQRQKALFDWLPEGVRIGYILAYLEHYLIFTIMQVQLSNSA